MTEDLGDLIDDLIEIGVLEEEQGVRQRPVSFCYRSPATGSSYRGHAPTRCFTSETILLECYYASR